MRALFAIVLTVSVAACAQLPPAGGSPEYGQAPSVPDETDRTPPSATAALLKQSRRQSASGQYSQAAASVERALRIEPGNPWLWLELAQIHRASGNLRQAEASAAKALSLSGPDRAAEQRARDILGQITGP